MVTHTASLTFEYSHTIGRQETRGGNGFFHPVALARGAGERLYVLSRGTETPVFWPCKRVTICTIEEEYLGQFGEKIPPEEAVPSAPDGTFFWPTSLALDRQENVYVADEWLNRISVFTKDGEWIGKWGTPGAREGEMDRPAGLAFSADEHLYMVDSRNNRIQVFTKDGKFVHTWGRHGRAEGELNLPWGLTIDQHGDVYVADWRNDRIQKFTADGRFLLQFGRSGQAEGEFNRPTGVAVDQEGLIYVTDFRNDRLQVFDAEGHFLTTLQGQASLSKWARERVELDQSIAKAWKSAYSLEERNQPFQGPIAVTVDAEQRVFVLETARHRVQVFQKKSHID
ncbi:MAG: NHL repeat-containing protein [Candidatus Tectimicrobiota bacterium]